VKICQMVIETGAHALKERNPWTKKLDPLSEVRNIRRQGHFSFKANVLSCRYLCHCRLQTADSLIIWFSNRLIQPCHCNKTEIHSHFTYLLTYLLHGTESLLRSWPVFAANQEIPRILWNPKFHYRTHKCPPPVSILSQLHPVPTTPSNFLNIHINIILQSPPESPQWPLSLRFPHQHRHSHFTWEYFKQE
jgi:hypothetical protein